ncbi:MAG: hypothetical protein LIP11_04500 [Clostridiales bacterium]|nr:hypothetical protein [Clostridiales bacterium]
MDFLAGQSLQSSEKAGGICLNWYRNLYIGNTFLKNKKKMMRMVEAQKAVPGLYLILLRTDTEHNQLEIVPQRCLAETVPDFSAAVILGMACGKEEAQELLLRMTEEVYFETQTADLRQFFLTRI